MEKLNNDFIAKTDKLNLNEEFGSELGGLASLVGENEGVAKIAKNEIAGGNLTQTMACALTANMDGIYEDSEKIDKFSKANKLLLEKIVNNGRGEGLYEDFNNGGKKKEIKNLIEEMAKLS